MPEIIKLYNLLANISKQIIDARKQEVSTIDIVVRGTSGYKTVTTGATMSLSGEFWIFYWRQTILYLDLYPKDRLLFPQSLITFNFFWGGSKSYECNINIH